MTTHHSGKRHHRYGTCYTRDAVGTLHVPELRYRSGPCESCGHDENCIATAATKGRYLCAACRPYIVDDEVKASLSERARKAGPGPQWSR